MGANKKEWSGSRFPWTWRCKVHMDECASLEKSTDDARMKKENPK